ncbi:hypothetical protein HAX54_004642 [Datura stramonium]|uniref:Uncharacterized protein n=1 Tax=Datura stramonium TaxID=4076 RepID=A0ABS8T8Q9_DATST|nr:hypothetical protein [Datura stramonium]
MRPPRGRGGGGFRGGRDGGRGFRGADGRGVAAFLIPLFSIYQGKGRFDVSLIFFHFLRSFELLERSKPLRRLILVFNGDFKEELEDREETTSDKEEDELPEDNNEKESVRESCEVDLDEHSIKLFFKGIYIVGPGGSGCRMLGIGVVMERAESAPPIQI